MAKSKSDGTSIGDIVRVISSVKTNNTSLLKTGRDKFTKDLALTYDARELAKALNRFGIQQIISVFQEIASDVSAKPGDRMTACEKLVAFHIAVIETNPVMAELLFKSAGDLEDKQDLKVAESEPLTPFQEFSRKQAVAGG